MRYFRSLLCLGLALLLGAALPVRSETLPSFPDDGDKASLLAALQRQRAYLSRDRATPLHLGDRTVTIQQLRETNEAFIRLVTDAYGTPEFDRQLSDRFEPVPFGLPGQAHFTGYHLPLLEARHHPDATFRLPLYRRPEDLQILDLAPFKPTLTGESVTGRVTEGHFVPYYSRADIEDHQALDGRGLAIAWVKDELARYLLMVQGSGLLRFEDGKQVVANFGGSNGRPYVSLGKLLVQDGKIPAERISVPAIRTYFAAHPDELHATLVRNPAYVFFKLASQGPFGVDGIPLTPGRSMATDKKLAPSGAIAYLRYPRADLGPDLRPTGFHESARFVCDQDTGSAIKGPGRADLYWGGGPEADAVAGTLNGTGSITYWILKSPAR